MLLTSNPFYMIDVFPNFATSRIYIEKKSNIVSIVFVSQDIFPKYTSLNGHVCMNENRMLKVSCASKDF